MPLSPTDIALIAAGPLSGVLNPDMSREEVAEYKPKDTKTIVWNLRNLDERADISGQFPAEDPVLNLSNTYGQHTSLNRQNPIVQFLHGDADTFSFTARFYAIHGGDRTPTKMIATLESWRLRDATLARPPRVAFTFGNIIPFPEAVITSISNISYSEPKPDGDIREVSCQVNLLRYTKFSLDNTPEPETRYYRAKQGDYYEMLAWLEYSAPLLGDALRKDHPEKSLLQEADIVRLPSYGAIRGTTITTTSIPLWRSYTTKDTAQRRLRQDEFERHDRDFTSGVIPAGL